MNQNWSSDANIFIACDADLIKAIHYNGERKESHFHKNHYAVPSP